jgi:ADP-heptose:LPS heptosyltransferase
MDKRPTAFSPQRILILHFGRLAEVTLSLPALKAVREHFSRSHITVAARPASCPLIEMTPYSDEITSVHELNLKGLIRPWRWVQFLQDVRSGRYDLVVDLQSGSRSNLFAWLSPAAVRLAARRPGPLDFLFNLWPSKEDPRKHLIDRYLDVLRPFGIESADRAVRVRPLPEVDQRVQKRLLNKGYRAGQLLVGLYAGAEDESGRWVLDGFVEVGKRLVHNLDVRLVVLGGPDDSQRAETVRQPLPSETILLNKLSIPELVSVLTRCTVLISDDAGAANLAAAVSTPVVGLGFSLTIAPLGREHVLIRPAALPHVTADEVFTAASQLIQRSRTTALFQD